MKRLLTAGLLLAAGAGAAQAQVEVSGNVALTSNYVFRGFTQTDDNPAIQGGLDADFGNGFYAGTWASSLDFGDGSASIEIDLYGGYAGDLTDAISYDVGVIYYAYPGADDDGGDYDFVEFYGGLGFAATDQLEFGGSLAYSPEFFGETGEAYYAKGTAAYAFNDMVSGDVGLGYSFGDAWEDSETTDWQVGVTFALEPFDLDFRYTDLDVDGVDLDDSENFIVTISKAL